MKTHVLLIAVLLSIVTVYFTPVSGKNRQFWSLCCLPSVVLLLCRTTHYHNDICLEHCKIHTLLFYFMRNNYTCFNALKRPVACFYNLKSESDASVTPTTNALCSSASVWCRWDHIPQARLTHTQSLSTATHFNEGGYHSITQTHPNIYTCSSHSSHIPPFSICARSPESVQGGRPLSAQLRVWVPQGGGQLWMPLPLRLCRQHVRVPAQHNVAHLRGFWNQRWLRRGRWYVLCTCPVLCLYLLSIGPVLNEWISNSWSSVICMSSDSSSDGSNAHRNHTYNRSNDQYFGRDRSRDLPATAACARSLPSPFPPSQPIIITIKPPPSTSLYHDVYTCLVWLRFISVVYRRPVYIMNTRRTHACTFECSYHFCLVSFPSVSVSFRLCLCLSLSFRLDELIIHGRQHNNVHTHRPVQ